jgi:hypothetical protein
MANKMIYAKDLKSNSIIFINNTAVMIKFVNVGPKSVYAAKALDGKSLSFPVNQVIEVS